MKTYLEKIARQQILTSSEAYAAMEFIFTQKVSIAKLAAFLAILHTRGEFPEELLGFIKYLRQQVINVDVGNMCVIDTCGTGGDHANTFNISTAAALLLASGGVKVAKHGGRSVSSQSGSADVLQALGIIAQENPVAVRKELEQFGFAFLFAPRFNQAFQTIATFRKDLGIRTSFNVLGPLLNPVNIKRQVLGVYSKRLLTPVAEILHQLGIDEAMVVHARDGLDEFSIYAPTDVAHLKKGEIRYFTVDPDELGIVLDSVEALSGGDALINANIIQQIFAGELGARREVVVLNAAAGFIVAGYTENFNDAITLARDGIDSGRAMNFLQQLQQHRAGQQHD